MSAPPPPVGVVTGLVAEARCLERCSNGAIPIVFCSGGSAARAREGARRLAADGAGGLLSFGMAGGLDPKLAPGALVLAARVVAPDGTRFDTSREWRERLRVEVSGGCELATGDVAGRDGPVHSPAEKRALYETTGAAAVDMESHAVAAVAREAGLPFLVVRAIADPAQRSVPSWALSGLAADGRTRPLAVLARLALRPWEAPGLLALARDSAAAMASLRRVADFSALFAAPR